MSTRTPGPWVIQVHPDGTLSVKRDGVKALTEADAKRLVRTLNSNDDLLAALEEIVGCEDGIGCRLTPAHGKQARNAIAQTRGETA